MRSSIAIAPWFIEFIHKLRTVGLYAYALAMRVVLGGLRVFGRCDGQNTHVYTHTFYTINPNLFDIFDIGRENFSPAKLRV